MASDQILLHVIAEIGAILISAYFIYLSKRFVSWKKYALLVIAIGVILIDTYTLFSWAGLVDWFPRRTFHMITEALALPAGILLIYLSRQKGLLKHESYALLVMGLLNIIVDGYLLLTW